MEIKYNAYSKYAKLGLIGILRLGHKKKVIKSAYTNSDRLVFTPLVTYFVFGLLFATAVYQDESFFGVEYYAPLFLLALLMFIIYLTFRIMGRVVRSRLVVVDFSRHNKIRYSNGIKVDSKCGQYVGSLFKGGYNKVITERLKSKLFEIGNYRYNVGALGFGGSVNNWGYISLKIKRKIPHLLLLKKDTILSNSLNISLDDDQKMSLEGNFNEYFDLYCPDKYRRDAYYILTPDLMQLLMDKTAKYNIEIIDDKCYIFGKKFDFGSEKKMREIISIIDTLSPKLDRQTRVYADEYVADKSKDIVSPLGRRLRHVRVDVVIGVAVAMIYILVRVRPVRDFMLSLFK